MTFCEVIMVDDQPVRVTLAEPLTDEEREEFTEYLRAVVRAGWRAAKKAPDE